MKSWKKNTKVHFCCLCSNNKNKFWKIEVLDSKAIPLNRFVILKNSMINQNNRECLNSQMGVNQVGSINLLHILQEFARYFKNKKWSKK